MRVRLTMTEEQYVAIMEVLYHVQLGERNKFESAISDFLIAQDNEDTNQITDLIKDRIGVPTVKAVYNDYTYHEVPILVLEE